jgi:FkbM family methyltransferase
MRIKTVIERRLPWFARVYRKARDTRYYARLETVASHGIVISGPKGTTDSLVCGLEISSLENLVSNADVFVDVGANIGVMCCVAARLGKYIIACEPHPKNLRALLCNLAQNGASENVEVYGQALSDRPCLADLFGGGQGASLVSGWGGMQETYATKIPVNTLDNLLSGRFSGKRIHVKIDVEGNELSVLAGAAQTLIRSPRPTWFLEIGLTENFNGSINPHFGDIFDLFWSHGYKASPMRTPNRVLAHKEVSGWIAKATTDHQDINYIFTTTE